MKLLGNTTSKITKDENVKNRLEITEVVLVHFKFVNNNYQHYLRVLYIFTPNKYFSQLLDIFQKVKISQKIQISQKLFDHAKQSTKDALETASKRAIRKNW